MRCLAFAAALAAANAYDAGVGVRAQAMADRLVTCDFAFDKGVWPNEDLWESGNTLGSVAATAGEKEGEKVASLRTPSPPLAPATR